MKVWGIPGQAGEDGGVGRYDGRLLDFFEVVDVFHVAWQLGARDYADRADFQLGVFLAQMWIGSHQGSAFLLGDIFAHGCILGPAEYEEVALVDEVEDLFFKDVAWAEGVSVVEVVYALSLVSQCQHFYAVGILVGI